MKTCPNNTHVDSIQQERVHDSPNDPEKPHAFLSREIVRWNKISGLKKPIVCYTGITLKSRKVHTLLDPFYFSFELVELKWLD